MSSKGRNYWPQKARSVRCTRNTLGYQQSDTVALRMKTKRTMSRWHKDLVCRLKAIFRSEICKFLTRGSKMPKIRFGSGPTVSIVICRSERSNRGAPRWRLFNTSAKRYGGMVLLCLCDSTNVRLRNFHVLPNLDNIKVSALLKEDDVRLTSGKQLRNLHDLRRIVASVGKR